MAERFSRSAMLDFLGGKLQMDGFPLISLHINLKRVPSKKGHATATYFPSQYLDFPGPRWFLLSFLDAGAGSSYKWGTPSGV